MSKVEITTNNHKRRLVTYHDLTTTEQEEFDYLNEEEKSEDRFVRYVGWVYDVTEFTIQGPNSELGALGWDYAQPDTMWSATILRWVQDDYGLEYEVVVGRAYWA